MLVIVVGYYKHIYKECSLIIGGGMGDKIEKENMQYDARFLQVNLQVNYFKTSFQGHPQYFSLVLLQSPPDNNEWSLKCL